MFLAKKSFKYDELLSIFLVACGITYMVLSANSYYIYYVSHFFNLPKTENLIKVFINANLKIPHYMIGQESIKTPHGTPGC